MRTISETNFYTPPEFIHTEILYLVEQEAKHARGVVRCAVGDVIHIVDGCGQEYEVCVQRMLEDRIECEILSTQKRLKESVVEVTLAQALCRPPKFDLVVEKGTELGVRAIVPTITERSQALPHEDRLRDRLSRWRHIAIAAMKQSGRSVLPRIEEPVSLDTLLALAGNVDVALMAWEGETSSDLRQIFSETRDIERLLVLVGPESGFSTEEIDRAKGIGFRPFSIGPRRLRTETAGIVSVSLVLYECGELNPR